MEIDITHMMADQDEMPMLSGSAFELGDNAGEITWNNSKQYASQHPLLTTEEQLEATRDHFREYGAWSRDEIAAWDAEELNALLVQDIAASIREMEAFDTIEGWKEASEHGNTSGRHYQGDNGRWYFYLGC